MKKGEIKSSYRGLTPAEVEASRAQSGENRLKSKRRSEFRELFLDLIREPMIILLLTASVIYFINKSYDDGFFMLFAIAFVVAIEIFQHNRTQKALARLQQLSQPRTLVIREGESVYIPSEEIVVGDIMVVEEGASINADADLLEVNDFSVNESVLTGESLPAEKDLETNPKIFKGSLVASGWALSRVTAVGNQTELGKIGLSIEDVAEEKTPLERQINNFVKKMVLAGAIVFAIVWLINYLQTYEVVESLLLSLTLAMSILPEEIPVAFSTFMALGAWRLMKLGIVVKKMKTVETLGSATVICSDKTGTITENRMSVAAVYSFADKSIHYPDNPDDSFLSIIEMGMWASEVTPFDTMEKALHELYAGLTPEDNRGKYVLLRDYPLSGKPPMMTHVFSGSDGKYLIASKGAPEAVLRVSEISETDKKEIQDVMNELAGKGYRLLGVARGHWNGGEDFPETQDGFTFQFIGLLAFFDPPKANIKEVLRHFEEAGIRFKIITGDNLLTTKAIAQQIGISNAEVGMTGDEILQMSEQELRQRVTDTTLFARMYPEAKLKIVNALKANNEIVAMTGDGVNDGPALKAAHIGIAMGNKGTEIAKQASSLVLANDDLSKMVDAIAMGRRIYSNLKKAIQYIISIHLPIILTVSLPLILGWIYPHIFTPAHIIFLELIMGPTCSIIFENEPLEENTMQQPPRPFTSTFLNLRELSISIIQGLVITLGILLVYQYGVRENATEEQVRSMVFLTLISANIFLTLVNRSFYYSLVYTAGYKNRLIPLIIFITVALVLLFFFIPSFSAFFKFGKIDLEHVLVAVGVGAVSVLWFEIWKLRKRGWKL